MGKETQNGAFVPLVWWPRTGEICELGRALSRGSQTQASGAQHRFGAAAKLELAVDVGQVIADRLRADAPRLGYLFDRCRRSDHGQDVQLGRRQLGQPGSDRGTLRPVEAG